MSETGLTTRRRAIVLVHGVGDSKPGDLIRAVSVPLVDAIPGLQLENHTKQFELPDRNHETGEPEEFIMMMREGCAGAERWLLAEVHWADVTRVKKETHSFILSFGKFLYGLRHIAEQAVLIKEIPATVLAVLLRIVVLILLGPITAMLIFELPLCFFYFAFIPRTWDDLPSGPIAAYLLQGIFAGVVAFGCLLARRFGFRNLTLTALMWTAVVAIAHAALVATENGRLWHASNIDPFLSVVENNLQRDIPSAWMLSVYLIDAILDFLGIIVSSCIILGGFIVLLSRKSSPKVFRSLRTSWLAGVMMIAIWVAAVIPANWFVQNAYDRDALKIQPYPQYTLWYDVACVALLSISCFAFGVLEVYRHRLWADRYRSNNPMQVPPAPRLIIATPILWCLLIFAFVYNPLAIIDGLPKFFVREFSIDYGFVHFFLMVATIGFLAWSEVSRNIIHILNDIVIHFARRDGFELFASPRIVLRYHIRRRLAKRLREVLKHVLKLNPDELILVAHSQGSMIVLEELLKPRSFALLNRVGSVKLVTLGSPLTHLYQHYFPFLYGDLTHGRWKRLRDQLPNWVNFYRIDDYVGTSIEAAEGVWPCNIALPPAGGLDGHTKYWNQSVITQIIDRIK